MTEHKLTGTNRVLGSRRSSSGGRRSEARTIEAGGPQGSERTTSISGSWRTGGLGSRMRIIGTTGSGDNSRQG
jgi:hypothetical protein